MIRSRNVPYVSERDRIETMKVATCLLNNKNKSVFCRLRLYNFVRLSFELLGSECDHARNEKYNDSNNCKDLLINVQQYLRGTLDFENFCSNNKNSSNSFQSCKYKNILSKCPQPLVNNSNIKNTGNRKNKTHIIELNNYIQTCMPLTVLVNLVSVFYLERKFQFMTIPSANKSGKWWSKETINNFDFKMFNTSISQLKNVTSVKQKFELSSRLYTDIENDIEKKIDELNKDPTNEGNNVADETPLLHQWRKFFSKKDHVVNNSDDTLNFSEIYSSGK